MPVSNPEYDRVWQQNTIPVIIRDGLIAPLVIRLPYSDGNRDWLRDDRRSKPKWMATHRAWSIPKTWFEHTVTRAIARFGAIWVIQPYRGIEKCAPACWKATGVHCECSCMGANHGSQNPFGRWYIIPKTFAFRVGPREYSCNLLRRQSTARATAQRGLANPF
jgi:hypothetical protein